MTFNAEKPGNKHGIRVSVLVAVICATVGWLAGAERQWATGDTSPSGRERQETPRGSASGLMATDRETRRRTAEELGRSNDERNVAPLVEVLRSDRDFIVRAAAADALGVLKSKLATAALGDALGDASPDVRAAAALALGRIGETRAVAALKTALRDSEAGVRSSAAQALGKLSAANAASDVLTLLNDPSEEVRTSAAEALGLIGGKDTVDALIRRLADKSLYVRSRAALALGKISDARAVAPLIESLKDMDRTVRASSAEALGKFKDRSAVRPLIDALTDRDPFVRLNAAYALGKIGDESAVDALTDALRDEDNRVRSRAVDALGGLATMRSLDPVIDSLRDSDAFVRVTAAQALGNFSNNERATDALLQTLSETDVQLRRRALESLGKIGDEKSLRAIQTAITDPSPIIRASAVAAYGRIGKAQAAPVLIEALRENDPQVRAAAAFALGQLHSPETAIALLQFIGSLDVERLGKLRGSLSGFFTAYGEVNGILESALRSNDASVRRGAALAADVILNTPNVLTALTVLLKDPSPDLRRLALEGLARRKSPVLTNEALQLLARDAAPEIRILAAQLLGDPASQAAPMVADALRSAFRSDASEDVRRQAGLSLDRLGVARVVLPNRERPEAATDVAAAPPRIEMDVVRNAGEAPPPASPRSTGNRTRSSRRVQNSETANVPAGEGRVPAVAVESRDEAERSSPSTSQGRRSSSPRASAKPRPVTNPPNADAVARVEPPPLTPTPKTAKIPARAAAIAANEAATFDFMQAVLQAETEYRKKFGPGKFAGLPELIAQNLIDERYASDELNGYRLTLYVSQALGTAEGNFFVLATPIEFDETGRKSFYMDGSGLVRIREARKGVRIEEIFGAWSLVGE